MTAVDCVSSLIEKQFNFVIELKMFSKQFKTKIIENNKQLSSRYIEWN